MTIYNIAGLDVGNDEELTRCLNKIYDQRKRIGCLVVNQDQLSFIEDCYDVWDENVQDDDGNTRTVRYFDPGWNPMEIRIEGIDEKEI